MIIPAWISVSAPLAIKVEPQEKHFSCGREPGIARFSNNRISWQTPGKLSVDGDTIISSCQQPCQCSYIIRADISISGMNIVPQTVGAWFSCNKQLFINIVLLRVVVVMPPRRNSPCAHHHLSAWFNKTLPLITSNELLHLAAIASRDWKFFMLQLFGCKSLRHLTCRNKRHERCRPQSVLSIRRKCLHRK